MDEEYYHIDFKRSGGVSGTSWGLELDSNELSYEEAETLKVLIDSSAFFETFTSHNALLDVPDQFRYKITIKAKEKSRTFEMSDISLPYRFRPLINYLLRLSRSRMESQ